MRFLSRGLNPARVFIQCTSVQNQQKTEFIDKKELILLLATPILRICDQLMSAGADVSFYANVYVGEFQARKRE